MPDIHEVIQVNEEISYPDGYNQVTVEGTGDEGGLGVSRYPDIQIYASPSVISSDGIATAEISVRVTDYQNPNFYKVQELVEVIESTSYTEVAVGKYITAISGTHTSGKVMGVYVYDGEDLNGDPALTGEVIALHETAPFYRQRIKFRDTRDTGDVSKYVVVYKGVETVTFNIGYENETWVPVEEFPEVDPPWTPAEKSEPGGMVLPSLCPFGEPGATTGAWIESQYASGGYQRAKIEYMPNAGDYGTATINVNYNGYQKYVQIEILNGTPLGNAGISLSADPSSIQINTETSLVELVIVTADGYDPVGTQVTFSQYSSPQPPEWGKVWWIGGTSKTVGTVAKEIEATSSDKRTVTVPYLINTITSIVAVPKPTDNWTWTWQPGLETIEKDTIHIPAENEFPIDATPLIIKGTMKGVAQTTVKGVTLGKVILVATVGDATPNATLTVTKESSVRDFTLEAEPTQLGFEESSVVTARFPNGAMTVLYEVIPEGANALKIIAAGGTKGVLTMPNTTSAQEYTEDVTPSDLRTITVSSKISSVISITTAHGRHPAIASIDGNTINLANALELEDFQTVTVVYMTDCVAVGSYVAPNNKMQVKILGRVYQTEQIRSVTISTSDCPEYRFDILSCEPDILNIAELKDEKKIPKIYPEDLPAKVTAILTYTDPNFAGNPEEETLEDRIPSDLTWVKVVQDKDPAKLFNGQFGAEAGYATGGNVTSDAKYAHMQTDIDGKFIFYLHPATGRGRTTLNMAVTDQLARDFEDNQELYCAYTQPIEYDTSRSYFDIATKDIYLGVIGVFVQPFERNASGAVQASDTVILTEGSIGSFGIMDEAASRNGFTETLPNDDPMLIHWPIPNALGLWIKKIYLEQSDYQLKAAGGSCFRIEGDTGAADWTPNSNSLNVDIEVVPPYRQNLKDYTFTVVDASRAIEGDTKAPAPVPGARVELANTSDAFNRSVAFSGPNGAVTFYGLSPGTTYTVHITSEGYRPNSIAAAELIGGGDADIDEVNDTITIPSYGYSDSDDYVILPEPVYITVKAIIYDTGAEEPVVVPVTTGGGGGNGGGGGEPPAE